MDHSGKMIVKNHASDNVFSQKMYVWRTMENYFHVRILILVYPNRTCVCPNRTCKKFENQTADEVLLAKMNFKQAIDDYENRYF